MGLVFHFWYIFLFSISRCTISFIFTAHLPSWSLIVFILIKIDNGSNIRAANKTWLKSSKVRWINIIGLACFFFLLSFNKRILLFLRWSYRYCCSSGMLVRYQALYLYWYPCCGFVLLDIYFLLTDREIEQYEMQNEWAWKQRLCWWNVMICVRVWSIHKME